jgi:hypothetical protein
MLCNGLSIIVPPVPNPNPFSSLPLFIGAAAPGFTNNPGPVIQVRALLSGVFLKTRLENKRASHNDH